MVWDFHIDEFIYMSKVPHFVERFFNVKRYHGSFSIFVSINNKLINKLNQLGRRTMIWSEAVLFETDFKLCTGLKSV